MAKKARRSARATGEEVILLDSSQRRAALAQSVTRKKLAELRNQFIHAHEDGMSALGSGDYDALGDAIERERKIINKQNALIRTKSSGATSRPKK